MLSACLLEVTSKLFHVHMSIRFGKLQGIQTSMLFYQTTAGEKNYQTTKHNVSFNSLLASSFTHELLKKMFD